MHCIEQCATSADIITVVQVRALNGFSPLDQSGKVENCIDCILGKKCIGADTITDIDFMQNLRRNGVSTPIGQVVNHPHLMARSQKQFYHVRADIPGSARYEQTHIISSGIEGMADSRYGDRLP